MEKTIKTVKICNIVMLCSYMMGILGFISVVRNIDILYSALFTVILAFSVYIEKRQSHPLPNWLVNIFSIIFVLIIPFRISMDEPVAPIVETMLILLGAKFLGKKSVRDYLQIYLISILLLAGSALLSLDMEFAAYLFLMIFLLSFSAIALTFYSQDSDSVLTLDVAKKLALKSLLIPLMSIPLTAFLFLILPRTSHPFLNFLNRDSGGVTGFTDSVRLGGVSDIQADESIIMRVSMQRIDDSLLYWRGVVLDFFDGISWTSKVSEAPTKDKKLALSGSKVSYTVYLEPYNNNYLFYLDKPLQVFQTNVIQFDGLTFRMPHDITRRIKYDAVSIISDSLNEYDINKEAYLQLPDRGLEKIKKTVTDITKDLGESESTEEILKYLKWGDYKYTLTNLPLSSNPLEDFIYNYKYGNCEFFASAMTVMLRLRGIPSRIIGGYAGGYYNDIGGYYAIPQKNAHVWVEAYIEKKGWIRFDPTPAPTAVFSSLPGGFSQIRAFFDSVSYHWNALIINYDFSKQAGLLKKARSFVQRPSLDVSVIKKYSTQIISGLTVSVLTILILYCAVLRRKAYEEKIIILFLQKMKRFGYEKTLSEGLEEFVGRIKNYEIREKAYVFVLEFERYFYRDEKLKRQDYLRLKRILSDIKAVSSD